MTFEFLLKPKVWAILKELNWGDRFESDLQVKLSSVRNGPESLAEIKSELLKRGLILELRGGAGSPYLSLTYKGQLVVGKLIETEEILNHENSG